VRLNSVILKVWVGNAAVGRGFEVYEECGMSCFNLRKRRNLIKMLKLCKTPL